MLPEALRGDNDTAGERLASKFVALISDGQTREMMLGMIRSVSSDAAAADALRQFVEDAIMKTIEEFLPGPNKRLQANILGGQLIGLFVARYIVKLDPIASIDDDQLVKYLAPRLQAHFLPIS